MNELTNLENFFKSHQIYLSRVWLESCVNWCKEENLPPNYTLKDLQINVFDQWLLLDLRDVEIPCLPNNLSADKCILKENYTLQLMKIVDISKPKYWQLQRIRNGTFKNVDQECESSKRVLQLTLTDGVQEVEAMEYKPIKCLNMNLSPGIKIRLMGPIHVRRGRLMLEEKNVNVIGGEVDTLLVSNAAENILAKHLNQPLNPEPQAIQENILRVDKDRLDETGVSSATISNSNTQNNLRNNFTSQNQIVKTATISNSNTQDNAGNNGPHQNQIVNRIHSSDNINNRTNQRSSTPKNNNFPTQLENFDDFDDFKLEEEIEMLMEVERDFEQSNVTSKDKNNTLDMFDDDDFENIQIPNNMESITESKTATIATNIINISGSSEEHNNSMDLNSVNTKPSTSKLHVSPKPVIWSIDRLVKTIPNITNGKFKIRATFKRIVEKMTFADNSLHLVAEVEDGSGEISLKFHCDVISAIIGYSVEEFMSLREEWSKNNQQAKAKILGALECLKNRLTDLDNVVEVLINAQEKFPVLLKIL